MSVGETDRSFQAEPQAIGAQELLQELSSDAVVNLALPWLE